MATPDFYIEGIPVYQRIIEPNGRNIPFLTMEPDYIVEHNTANTDPRADAFMHNKFIANGGGRAKVSFHFNVDDECIVQNLRTNQVGWQAGDGYNGKGNRRGIAIEICENGNHSKAEAHAQALTRYLMRKENISISYVDPHKAFSGKNCPRRILPHWGTFIHKVKHGEVNYSPMDKGYLMKGDRGASVGQLQKNLLELGFKLPEYGVDNSFGDETENALIEFQKKMKIKPDGLYGPDAQKTMKEALEDLRSKPDVKELKDADAFDDVQLRVIYSGYDELNIRKVPDWEAKPYATYKKDVRRKVLGLYQVDNGQMYKIRGGDGRIYYISAADDHVELENVEEYEMAQNEKATGFKDVRHDDYHAEAIQWAEQQELIQGDGKGNFYPDEPLSRGDAALLFWRNAGKPKPE